jgi:predicted nucleic acid-binding protein
MAWVFEDEVNPAADALLKLLREDDSVVVPAVLWGLEMRNALRTGIIRQRITPEHAAVVRVLLGGLPAIAVACAHGLGDAVNDVMMAHDLTSHDAAYLVVAVEHQLPLATADKGLEKAARDRGVPLWMD